MLFSEVKVNGRLEVELENDDYRLVRGLVIDVDKKNDAFMLVDEYGSFVAIEKHVIVSISKIVLDKRVLEAMYDYKKYYKEKEKHIQAIEELELALPQLKDNINDSRFVVNFNIHGASVRLKAQLTEADLNFKSTEFIYEVGIDSNLNNQIELCFVVKKVFNYYDVEDKNKLLEAHAPKIKDSLDKLFKTDCIEKKSKLVHVEDETYYAISEYVVLVPVSEDNYLERKLFITETINKLRRNIK